jgi:hypothetical protein
MADRSNANETGAALGELPEAALLEAVQRRTFRYFWDMAHPASGLARDRVSGPRDLVTIGGSGFGVMAIIVAAERGWITRAQGIERLGRMLDCLESAETHHGVFPHFMNGATGKTIPFMANDDGGDLVETSLLIQGLLCARQYFAADTAVETSLRERIDALWRKVEWDWHVREGEHVLTWHWSPHAGWAMNHHIRGWNECLITYVLAASSPTYAIDPAVYHSGWASGPEFRNGRSYYGIELPLGPPLGGPLFFAHYSFLGLDPRGLKDAYADYWQQNVAHTRINHAYCIDNPNHCAGYGAQCWGLTASDNQDGYSAHAPTNDLCVIAPTAAISSLPYAPELVVPTLRYFLRELGGHIWRDCGFCDAFNEQAGWYAAEHLAIDQGPIILMIENYRTGLLWRLFMSCDEVQKGLKALGFASPKLA